MYYWNYFWNFQCSVGHCWIELVTYELHLIPFWKFLGSYFQVMFSSLLQLIFLCELNFTAQAIILAFQHYIVMLGSTVLIASTLVPLMGGNNVCGFWPCQAEMVTSFLYCWSKLSKTCSSFDRVTKVAWSRRCFLWQEWIHCFKHYSGRGFLLWWVHHSHSSYQSCPLLMILLIRPSNLSMRYVNSI